MLPLVKHDQALDGDLVGRVLVSTGGMVTADVVQRLHDGAHPSDLTLTLARSPGQILERRQSGIAHLAVQAEQPEDFVPQFCF